MDSTHQKKVTLKKQDASSSSLSSSTSTTTKPKAKLPATSTSVLPPSSSAKVTPKLASPSTASSMAEQLTHAAPPVDSVELFPALPAKISSPARVPLSAHSHLPDLSSISSTSAAAPAKSVLSYSAAATKLKPKTRKPVIATSASIETTSVTSTSTPSGATESDIAFIAAATAVNGDTSMAASTLTAMLLPLSTEEAKHTTSSSPRTAAGKRGSATPSTSNSPIIAPIAAPSNSSIITSVIGALPVSSVSNAKGGILGEIPATNAPSGEGDALETVLSHINLGISATALNSSPQQTMKKSTEHIISPHKPLSFTAAPSPPTGSPLSSFPILPSLPLSFPDLSAPSSEEMAVLQLLLGECVEEVERRVTQKARSSGPTLGLLGSHPSGSTLPMLAPITATKLDSGLSQPKSSPRKPLLPETTTAGNLDIQPSTAPLQPSNTFPLAGIDALVGPEKATKTHTDADLADIEIDYSRLPQPNMNDYLCSVCHKTAHCCYCGISFSSEIQHGEHNQGRKHKQVLLQFIESGIKQLPPVEQPFVCTVCRRNFYCEICNKPFCSEMQMQDHLNGRKHKKLAAKLTNKFGSDDGTDDTVVTNGGVISENEPAHKAFGQATVKHHNGASDYMHSNDGDFFCHICQVPLTGIKQKEEHNRGARHAQLLQMHLQQQQNGSGVSPVNPPKWSHRQGNTGNITGGHPQNSANANIYAPSANRMGRGGRNGRGGMYGGAGFYPNAAINQGFNNPYAMGRMYGDVLMDPTAYYYTPYPQNPMYSPHSPSAPFVDTTGMVMMAGNVGNPYIVPYVSPLAAAGGHPFVGMAPMGGGNVVDGHSNMGSNSNSSSNTSVPNTAQPQPSSQPHSQSSQPQQPSSQAQAPAQVQPQTGDNETFSIVYTPYPTIYPESFTPVEPHPALPAPQSEPLVPLEQIPVEIPPPPLSPVPFDLLSPIMSPASSPQGAVAFPVPLLPLHLNYGYMPPEHMPVMQAPPAGSGSSNRYHRKQHSHDSSKTPQTPDSGSKTPAQNSVSPASMPAKAKNEHKKPEATVAQAMNA